MVAQFFIVSRLETPRVRLTRSEGVDTEDKYVADQFGSIEFGDGGVIDGAAHHLAEAFENSASEKLREDQCTLVSIEIRTGA